MKRLLTILAAILLTVLCGNVYAQKNKNDNDYNLKKAYEVLNEEKDEAKALDLVNEQLRETPDNVDALVLRVRLLRRKKDFGQALRDINQALKVNKPKKTEMQNSTLHWWKAYIYRNMGDNQNAAASFKTAYELAQKDDKDNLQSISFDYAQSLYDMEDIAAAANISRSKCCKIFQQYLQQSPVAFLNAYRMEISCNLLRNTSYSITEIALSCGYNHLSYFSKMFSGLNIPYLVLY